MIGWIILILAIGSIGFLVLLAICACLIAGHDPNA